MPRICSVCAHEMRDEIDNAIASGKESLRGIARQYSLSPDAMERHAAEHIRESIKQSQIAAKEARGLNVVRQLGVVNNVALTILQEARASKDQEIALKAIDRVMKQLEFQAKLLGDIDKPQVNIIISPEWLSIRSLIVQVLAPYPDARLAVAMALSQMEASRAGLN